MFALLSVCFRQIDKLNDDHQHQASFSMGVSDSPLSCGWLCFLTVFFNERKKIDKQQAASLWVVVLFSRFVLFSFGEKVAELPSERGLPSLT